MFLSWLHLVSLTVYLGSVIGLRTIFLPALSLLRDPRAQVPFLARGLKIYNPLQIGALGLLVLSGALQLTDLKAAHRQLFIRTLGVTLGIKLIFSFALILLSVYQSMAVAQRFVRKFESGDPLSPEELESVTRRLKVLTLPIALLAVITLWLGLRMQG